MLLSAGVGGKWKMNVFDRSDMLGESSLTSLVLWHRGKRLGMHIFGCRKIAGKFFVSANLRSCNLELNTPILDKFWSKLKF